MKRLTSEGRFACGVDELLKGKTWAFVPVVNEYGIGLGAAVANEPGYYPISMTWCRAEKYDEMADYADELNEAMGLTPKAAAMVVCSSIRKGR